MGSPAIFKGSFVKLLKNTIELFNGVQVSFPAATTTLVGTDSTQTLTNKTIDGDNNTVQDLALTSIKTVLADANKVLRRDASGVPISGNTLPNSSAIVTTDATQTLENKQYGATTGQTFNAYVGSSGANFFYDGASTYFGVQPEDANGVVKIKYGATSGAAPEFRIINDSNTVQASVTDSGVWTIGKTGAQANNINHRVNARQVAFVSGSGNNLTEGIEVWRDPSLPTQRVIINANTGITNFVSQIGTTYGEFYHRNYNGTTVQVLTITGSLTFAAVNSAAPGNFATDAVFYVYRDNTTNRSINASGTINASGADYAEYMTKDVPGDVIAKGEVCGVKANGKLTKVFSESISFVVKSTNPSLVGGDDWFESMTAEELEAMTPEEKVDFRAALEVSRQAVDRISFCGQVPCFVSGSFNVGDYLVAQDNGSDGIEAVAVSKASITFEQYKNSLGQVWKDLGDSKALVAIGLK